MKKRKKIEKPEPVAPAEPEPERNLGGRPSSFQPQFAREAQMLCQLGATDQEMADFFEVTIRTINRWKVMHPEFAAALRRGKDMADERVEASLYHRAMGVEYEQAEAVKLKKVIYNDEGKKVAEEERVETVMVTKVIPADTQAAIFWLKNRRTEQWRDVQRHEYGKPGEFDQLSDAELDELIREEAERVVAEAKAARRAN